MAVEEVVVIDGVAGVDDVGEPVDDAAVASGFGEFVAVAAGVAGSVDW